MRETDLIIGRFADAAIHELTPDELTAFERLLEVPDRELLAWFTGETVAPAEHDTPLLHRMRELSRRTAGES
jgi:antitoxin CptB